jgi:predicted O-methyltransferase YrrM
MWAGRKNPSPRYLEIGIYGGGTIKYMIDHVTNIVCTGADLFEDLQIIANTHDGGNYTMHDVQEFLGSDVRLIKGDSAVTLPQLDEKFDLIFIDGNHTYAATKIDLENSLNLLEDGGFFALHNCSPVGDPDWWDYNRKDGGPWQVCCELKMDPRFVLLAEVDRIAVFARNPSYQG